MRAIGILELTESHENKLLTTSRMADTEENDVTVFTTEATYESVAPDLQADRTAVEWQLHDRDEDESLDSYLNRVERYCSEHIDFLMIQTVDTSLRGLVRYLRFDPDCVTMLWVYNLASWFAPGTIREPYPYVSKKLRRRLIRRHDYVNVQYPPLREYIATLSPDVKVTSVVPVTFDPAQANKERDDELLLTVPGSIEEKRRDYSLVLDAFKSSFDPSDQVRLCLLGKPKGEYGEEILGGCSELEDDGYHVQTFSDRVPVAAYNGTLADSDVLLSPLRETIEKPVSQERYGVTKDSGNVWDALTTATPIVLPHYYKLASFIESSAQQFDDAAAFEELLAEFYTDRDSLGELQDNARANANELTLEKQRDRYDELVSAVLDGQQPNIWYD